MEGKKGRFSPQGELCLFRTTRGFTFVEMVAVALLIGVFSSLLGPPTENFVAGTYVSSAAKTFLSDVRMARFEAIRTGRVHRLDLSKIEAGNTYTIEVSKWTIEDIAAESEPAESDWSVSLDEPERELSPELTVTVSSAQPVYFLPDGKLADRWTIGDPGAPLFPRTISFNYGAATATLTMSGSGILSSNEFYEEDI